MGRGSTSVQFIMAGMPLAVGALLVSTLKDVLPKMHADVEWHFHPAIMFRSGPDDLFDLSAWSAAFGGNAEDVVIDLECDVATEFANRDAMWKKVATKFICVGAAVAEVSWRRVPARS